MSNKPSKLMDTPTMVFFAIILIVIGFVMIMPGLEDSAKTKHIPYNEFIQQIVSGQVSMVVINKDVIFGRFKEGNQFKTVQPSNDPQLMNDLLNHKVTVQVVEHEEPSFIWSWMPTLLLIGVIIWFYRKQTKVMTGGGTGNGASGTRSNMINAEDIGVTFDDVAGIDEAKADLVETIEFLKNPGKFARIGGKMPHGIIMSGPPGNGKTLLAKAIAGEAKVPFFSKAGSDFVEKFVGVGASRVRELFDEAKRNAPCIIFIDEIDAVGKSRDNGLMSNDEREGTLNALLVEMDGFANNLGVVVIAATNRPEILDKALMRPGRFDRQVNVSLPDINGREKILKVHSKNILIDPELDFKTIARGCVGFSGADLANLMNEAALTATRMNADYVTMKHVEQSKDKIMMGAERKNMPMTDAEKECTAYHEAGHAIVGLSVPEHDPVHKISIIPRGRALGVTMYLPEMDRVSYSKRRLESQLASLMGGRAAEELIFGIDSVTTGASNDIERATSLAKQMVTKWGFNKHLGTLDIGKNDRSYSEDRSPELLKAIDDEVKELVDNAYVRAKQILTDKMSILHAMSGALVEFETLDRTQVEVLMKDDKVNE